MKMPDKHTIDKVLRNAASNHRHHRFGMYPMKCRQAEYSLRYCRQPTE